jgi:hypothetical protein
LLAFENAFDHCTDGVVIIDDEDSFSGVLL